MSDSPRGSLKEDTKDFELIAVDRRYELLRQRPVTPATSVKVDVAGRPTSSQRGFSQPKDDSIDRHYGLKILGCNSPYIAERPLSAISRLGEITEESMEVDGDELVKSQPDNDSDTEITSDFQREKIRRSQPAIPLRLNKDDHLSKVSSKGITIHSLSSNTVVVVPETHRNKTPRPGTTRSSGDEQPVYPTSANKSKLSQNRRRRFTRISPSQEVLSTRLHSNILRSVSDEDDELEKTHVSCMYARDEDDISDAGRSDYSAPDSARSTMFNVRELCRPSTVSSEILTEGALASKDDNLLKTLMKILKIENASGENWYTGVDEDDEDSTINKLRQLTKLFYKREEKKSSSVGLVYTYKLLLGSLHNRLEDFVLLPVPPGFNVRTRITRIKKGLNRRFYPVYYLHLEREGPGDRKCLILIAKKLKSVSGTTYILSTDPSEISKSSEYCVGLIESNFIGTEFTLFGGRSICTDVPPDKGALTVVPAEERFKEELALVLYDPNVLGFKGPRKIKVIVPKMKSIYEREQVLPRITEETLLHQYRNEEEDSLLCLKNKEPMWSKETHSYILNFGGRVSTPSVKNFQIVCPEYNEESNIMLQFGRASENTFSLDFKYPFCPLQAFAIALTSFESKLACE